MYASWRAAVSQDGLLLESGLVYEQWTNGALRARSRVPAEACGVSLAFLKQLASSFEVRFFYGYEHFAGVLDAV